MNRLIVLQELRLSSQRLPRKALQVVGDQRLIDIGLEKLRELQQTTGIDVAVVACEEETEICDAAEYHGLPLIPKSAASAQAEGWVEQMDGWQDALRPWDWVLFGNIVCHAFLQVSTIAALVRRAQESTHPWISCVGERGQVWRGTEPLLTADEVANAKTSPTYRRPVYLGLACAVTDLYEFDRILRPHPEVFEVPPIERIDIDTAADLEFARVVAAGLVTLSR